MKKLFLMCAILLPLFLSPLTVAAAESATAELAAAEPAAVELAAAEPIAAEPAAPEPPDAVSYAAEHGYLFEASREDAGGALNRGEWAYMLDEWMNYLQPTLTTIGYAPQPAEVLLDDISGHDFYNSIFNLAERGLVEEGMFAYRPDETLTRQEFCEFMTAALRKIGVGPQEALDVDAIAWNYLDWYDIMPAYEDDVAFMIYIGLVSSVGDGMFAPEAAITRAQVCTVLLRAEVLVRGKERNLQAEQFGDTNLMFVARVNGSNITSGGFNIEVTVNDSAKALNPHVIVAYAHDEAEIPTTDSILSGRFGTQTQRLTEMRRINTAADETTYSVRFNGKPNTVYFMYVLLKNGSEYSNIVSYNVTMPGVQ